MKAFTNTPITKEKFLEHLKWHQDQDAFVRGDYDNGKEGKDFRGCAIGCSIHSIQIELGIKQIRYYEHSLYEKYLNVPEWLARLEDSIFERLPLDRSKTWPVDFAEAIVVGSNLDEIKIPFLIYIVEGTLDSFDHESNPMVKQVIDNVLFELKRETLDKAKLLEAAHAAIAAAHAAYATADAAYASDAAHAAYAAAYATADAAEASYAAANASYAANAAAHAAYAAYATADAYSNFANKLLELMRGLGSNEGLQE